MHIIRDIFTYHFLFLNKVTSTIETHTNSCEVSSLNMKMCSLTILILSV